MEKNLTSKKLTNGDVYVFNTSTKELFLISKSNVKNWEKSNKTSVSLKEMVNGGKATYFDKKTLIKISAVLQKIALLGV